MRGLVAGSMAIGLIGLGLAVVAAGKTIGEARVELPWTAAKGEMFGPLVPPDFQPLERDLHPLPARPVEPGIVAPPPIDYATLVRAAPRNPLSDLASALPPKPKQGGTLLYRPLVTASAEFESMGYRIAISGTESIGLLEKCVHDRTVWPCGIRARAAVRMWLRGRALACDVPVDPERRLIAAECRLGAQDVGAWLVSNGWARASKGSRYQRAEALARDTGMGIFGAPYSTTN
jgi:hypothetical protein